MSAPSIELRLGNGLEYDFKRILRHNSASRAVSLQLAGRPASQQPVFAVWGKLDCLLSFESVVSFPAGRWVAQTIIRSFVRSSVGSFTNSSSLGHTDAGERIPASRQFSIRDPSFIQCSLELKIVVRRRTELETEPVSTSSHLEPLENTDPLKSSSPPPLHLVPV